MSYYCDKRPRYPRGAIEVEGRRVFWKIDYGDRECEFGSPDPAALPTPSPNE